MKISTAIVCGLMFTASFCIIGSNYDLLPAQLPVLRKPFAGIVMVAPKSAFTAFRVPLMNLAHGLMAAVMLSRAADFKDEEPRASYVAFFSTLLVAIAMKSDFEALEFSAMVSPRIGRLRDWLTAGTVLSVVGGVVLAFLRARKARIPWAALQLSTRGKAILISLFAAYLTMVAASLLVSNQA